MGAPRTITILRAIILLVAFTFLASWAFPAILRCAQLWTPIGIADGARNLPGSAMDIEDAVAKGRDVFAGSITEAGSEVPLPPGMSMRGNLYRDIKVTILQVYSDHKLRTLPQQQLDPLAGPIGDQTSIALVVDTLSGETRPQVGKAYIFVAAINQGNPDGTGTASPYNHLDKDDGIYIALKLLPVTDNNITIVTKWIDRRRRIFLLLN